MPVPKNCWSCKHNHKSPILSSPSIDEGWCKLEDPPRSTQKPKVNPPPEWCKLREAKKEK